MDPYTNSSRPKYAISLVINNYYSSNDNTKNITLLTTKYYLYDYHFNYLFLCIDNTRLK